MTSNPEEWKAVSDRLGPCWFCGGQCVGAFAVPRDPLGVGLYLTCERCGKALKFGWSQPFYFARLTYFFVRKVRRDPALLLRVKSIGRDRDHRESS